MANPVIVSLPANTWVKVATGVTAGMLWLRSMAARHIVMYQCDTTNPAPTDLSEAVRVFLDGDNSLAISASDSKDIYLQSIDADGEKDLSLARIEFRIIPNGTLPDNAVAIVASLRESAQKAEELDETTARNLIKSAGQLIDHVRTHIQIT